jgi:hypothetical protein
MGIAKNDAISFVGKFYRAGGWILTQSTNGGSVNVRNSSFGSRFSLMILLLHAGKRSIVKRMFSRQTNQLDALSLELVRFGLKCLDEGHRQIAEGIYDTVSTQMRSLVLLNGDTVWQFLTGLRKHEESINLLGERKLKNGSSFRTVFFEGISRYCSGDFEGLRLHLGSEGAECERVDFAFLSFLASQHEERIETRLIEDAELKRSPFPNECFDLLLKNWAGGLIKCHQGNLSEAAHEFGTFLKNQSKNAVWNECMAFYAALCHLGANDSLAALNAASSTLRNQYHPDTWTMKPTRLVSLILESGNPETVVKHAGKLADEWMHPAWQIHLWAALIATIAYFRMGDKSNSLHYLEHFFRDAFFKNNPKIELIAEEARAALYKDDLDTVLEKMAEIWSFNAPRGQWIINIGKRLMDLI